MQCRAARGCWHAGCSGLRHWLRPSAQHTAPTPYSPGEGFEAPNTFRFTPWGAALPVELRSSWTEGVLQGPHPSPRPGAHPTAVPAAAAAREAAVSGERGRRGRRGSQIHPTGSEGAAGCSAALHLDVVGQLHGAVLSLLGQVDAVQVLHEKRPSQISSPRGLPHTPAQIPNEGNASKNPNPRALSLPWLLTGSESSGKEHGRPHERSALTKSCVKAALLNDPNPQHRATGSQRRATPPYPPGTEHTAPADGHRLKSCTLGGWTAAQDAGGCTAPTW